MPITQKTPQSTGGRGPLQYKCVINQGQPTKRVQYSIPTCLHLDKAKRPGRHTQGMTSNPYSLMYGIIDISTSTKWDRTTQRKEKKEEEEKKYI